ncbi:MAG: glycosyltransferase [Lewinellaceae bacterium]|nr:glycosyltransferase [Lewinellaceae bacterium]
MRILQLCNKFPWPLKDGAAIASTYLARALADLGSDVTLLAMNTSKHWFDTSMLPTDFGHYSDIHTVYVDNRIRPMDAFFNLFTDKSYHVERFADEEFAQKLSQILQEQQFDVIQLESLYLTPFIPVIRKYSSALIALRAHNVEHEIWERVAGNSNPLKKWYLQKITPRLKQYEVEHLNEYDLVIGISERDMAQFRQLGLKKPTAVTPIGLDCRDYEADFSSFSQPLSLSFIGSLDWMPNLEGLKWFLEEVWTPVLAPSFPELTFHVAGRTAPRWLQQLKVERVVFHGEVPSSPDFLNRHSIMVVPLLSGGGMRAKILEGMACGKVVLSTSVGMEGIDAGHRKECLLADTPQSFSDAIRWCYAQGGGLENMGHKARAFCCAHYDNREVGKRLLETYRSLRPKRPVAVES